MKKFYIGMAIVFTAIAITFGVYYTVNNTQPKETVVADNETKSAVSSQVEKTINEFNEDIEEIAKVAYEENVKIVNNYINSLSQDELDSITSPDMLPKDVRDAYYTCMLFSA